MSRWDAEYRGLSAAGRTAVNDLVNGIFRQQTGFQGKIDPRANPALAAKWLAVRDQVLANRLRFARWLQGAVAGAADVLQATAIYSKLDTAPPWIQIARRECEAGVQEIPGARHNPRIMEYIRTCANIQETEGQRRYVEREGEEGVEWCSAFVNWCLRQAGIIGTNHALAASWSKWGEPLTGPQRGAVVGFSWKGASKIHHVAFCDEVNGEFKMLGGNQVGGGGKVTSVPFPKSSARYYRKPVTA